MAIGQHLDAQGWNSRLFALYQLYRQFCNQAQEMAAVIAPLADQHFIDLGFSSADTTDLKSFVNIMDALRRVSQGDNTVTATAEQASVIAPKCGDLG